MLSRSSGDNNSSVDADGVIVTKPPSTNNKALRSLADSHTRNMLKNDKVIPEVISESMKKEDEIAEAEPLVARLEEHRKNNVEKKTEEAKGRGQKTTSLLAGLSIKYNLSGKLPHLMMHTLNTDQQPKQQQDDVELGALAK